MDFTESATTIAVALLKKSGVKEWEDVVAAERIANTAWAIATFIQEGQLMALPDYFKVEPGTALTLKSTSGSATLTFASHATATAAQSGTLDFGSNWAQCWRFRCDVLIQATPTAGNTIDFYASWNSATGAGLANTSGSDGNYTGYSSNPTESVKQLEFIGSHVCTVQTTLQSSYVGMVFPKARYCNLVMFNNSGATLSATETNQVLTFTPLEQLVQDAV